MCYVRSWSRFLLYIFFTTHNYKPLPEAENTGGDSKTAYRGMIQDVQET